MNTPESNVPEIVQSAEAWKDNLFANFEKRYGNLTDAHKAERGGIGASLASSLLVKVAAGLLVVGGTVEFAPAVAGGVMSRVNAQEVIDSQNSHLKAEKIHAEDVHFDFRTVSVWAVEGQVGTRWTVFGKEVPGSGFGAKFQNSDTTGTATDPRSKMLLWSGSGNLNSEPQGPQVVVKVEGDKQIVNFPLGALVVNTQFSEADTKVVQADRTFTQGLESITGLLGFASKVACNLVTLGKNQEGCSALFDFTAWANNNQTEVEQLLRYKTLEEVQKTCAPQQWKKESALIVKSFQDEGVKKGWKKGDTIVNFVDSTGNVTTATPDYTHNVLDGLKKKGILLKAPSGFSVQPVFSSIKCSEAKQAMTPTPGATGN